MKINILYFINTLGPGGTEKQLIEIVKNISKSDYTPHLCVLNGSTSSLPDPSIRFLNFNFSRYYYPSFLIQFLRFFRYCKRNEIRIIQTYFQDPSFICALMKLFYRAKFIVSFRDLGFWRTPIEDFKMRFASKLSDLIISNSYAVKNYFMSEYAIPSHKMKVVYNGVACKVNSAESARNRLKYNTPVIGIVANLNRTVKRVQDFILAARYVIEKYPNARFIIVGDGHLRKDYVSLAKDLGLIDQVEFVGRVNNPEYYIQQFNVGVICSESEGFSNAILEYMAHGVPVVASRVGGNREIIRNGENGYLALVGDPLSLSNNILEILDNRLLAENIGINNINKCRQKYSIERMVSDYERQYLYLLEKNNENH